MIRSDRIRDVALVKADAGGRTPLRLRRAPIQPGETVFAIGAPLDQEFQARSPAAWSPPTAPWTA